MKILKLALIGVILIACFKLFPQEDKKAEKARTELSEAIVDSAADFLKFKQQAETNISSNKKKIAALKAKKRDADKKVNKKYDEKWCDGHLEEKEKKRIMYTSAFASTNQFYRALKKSFFVVFDLTC